MKPFEAYKKYIAIKSHFQSKYDFFKFKGVVKANQQNFEVRRDKAFLHKVSKIYNEEQYQQYLVANFLQNKDIWIGDIFSESGRQKYLDYKKRIQSLEYTFTNDMKKIKDMLDSKIILKFDELFVIKQNEDFPLLVAMVFDGTIEFESFIIMNKILKFLDNFNKTITDEIIWADFRQKCVKYSPFLQIDLPKYKKIMKDIFIEKNT